LTSLHTNDILLMENVFSKRFPKWFGKYYF